MAVWVLRVVSTSRIKVWIQKTTFYVEIKKKSTFSKVEISHPINSLNKLQRVRATLGINFYTPNQRQCIYIKVKWRNTIC